MFLRPIAAMVLALVCAAPALAQAPVPDPVMAEVLAGPQRLPANRARDVWRHPAETLAFWGLKPGITVLEISPAGGWWTEILAPYAKRTGGRYIGTGAPLNDPGLPANMVAGRKAFDARFADEAVFGKVTVIPLTRTSRGLGPDNSVDVVFTARNVHNWIGQPGRVDEMFTDMFKVLKPGGVLGVKDHRSDPGPMKPAASDGYMSEAFIIAAAEKAGFKLDGRSEINANPKDTKDHPFGVWTLPPVRQSAPRGQPADPKFGRAKYEAIGESDRMTLRFVKPG